MLLKTIIKETVSLQGFKIESIGKIKGAFLVELMPDLRYNPLCGRCQKPGRFRDIRPQRHFKHVPLWNIPVELAYSRGVRTKAFSKIPKQNGQEIF